MASPFLFGYDDWIDEHTRLQLNLVERCEDAVFLAVSHGGLVNEYQQVNVRVWPGITSGFTAVKAGVKLQRQ